MLMGGEEGIAFSAEYDGPPIVVSEERPGPIVFFPDASPSNYYGDDYGGGNYPGIPILYPNYSTYYTSELQAFELEYRSHMSPSELHIFDNMPLWQRIAFLINAKYSMTSAENRYPGSQLTNGRGDAYRHTLFNALNTIDLGSELTKNLGDAHEEISGSDISRDMDLYNNGVGRDLIDRYNSVPGNTVEEKIIHLLNNGELKIIVNGELVPSR